MKQHWIFVPMCFQLFFAGIPSYASKPTPGILTGNVFDSRNNQPLSNTMACLKESNQTAISDSSGVFRIQSVMPGIYTLLVTADGYDTMIVPNIAARSKKNDLLTISLQKTVQSLDKIVITENRLVSKKMDQFHSVTRLSNFELNNTAATFNDINRTLEYIPGVSNQLTNDYFNEFIVRGGDRSENIFIVDNIELENPNHFGLYGTNGGYLNFINSSFVRGLDFYSGAIPVKYAPRLSSVSDIRLREGSLLNRKHSIEFNNIMLGFATEGPLPKSAGSYLVNAQAFNLNFMKHFMDWGDIPALQNYQTKFHFALGNNQAIEFNAIGAYDIMNKGRPAMQMTIGETKENLIYTQHGSAIQWQLLNDSFRNELIASFLYRRFGEEEQFTEDSEGKYGFEEVAEFSDIRKSFQLKNNSTLFINENSQLDFGISLERKFFGLRERTNCVYDDQFWKYSATIITDEWLKQYTAATGDDSSLVAGDTIPFFSGLNQAPLQKKEKSGDHIGGYLHYLFRNNNLKCGLGLRGDYYTLVHKPGISPRASVSYDAGSVGTISADVGLLYQFPTYLEPWLFSSYTGGSLSTFDLQRCTQGGIGFEKLFKQVYRFSIEGYYKWYDREFIYNNPDGPELIGSLVLNDQEDLQTTPLQKGKKRSYGIDLSIKKMQFDKFYFSIGYSFNMTERKYANNKWYPDAQNRRNSGFCTIGSNYFKHHGLALTLKAGEGVPYSTMKAVQDALVWNDGSVHHAYHLEHLDEQYWMHKRFDPYVLLGLRYSFRLFPRWGNITGYVDIQNIMDRRIPYALDYDPDTGEITTLKGSSLLPMFGIVADF
ncbi:MAG TPA: TonB-dependent receptor [Chitinispirillaceae bacterium]|nr:TonB-dependent receptor [Chitinispirillaceae bacterium]